MTQAETILTVPTECCPVCKAPTSDAKEDILFPLWQKNAIGSTKGMDWVQCTCGVCYRLTMFDEEVAARYYRESYRDPGYPSLHDRVVQLTRAERIIEYTKTVKKTPGRTLDFGCAAGVLLEEVRKEWDVDVVGVELNPTDHLLAAEKGIKVYDTLEEVSGTFDTVYMAHVLEHLTHPIEFLVNLKKYVNPGGDLILEMPDPYANGAWADFHMTCWSATVINQAFLRAGWYHVGTATSKKWSLVYWAAARRPE